ncbi:alpha/beta fold hydrolase [Gordonia sp. zg691]|uniref:alpha/beta hydrolase n=1 Tax=Gordonia jinghuaiqii TaxID=2758710 RepID=UPI0016625F8D|nr:alpha/beta fold hydrolase [Gordonia jinghuaiqii]MBD0861296.1 alpha/beta fold hydrolase [Gordonia jinghuaiqii]
MSAQTIHPIRAQAQPSGVARHRPRPPDRSGSVLRERVSLAFDVYEAVCEAGVHEAGAPTIVLLPTWSIVDSRIWKLQVPYLARHHRVVTFDGRGSGRSGRPVGAAAYTDENYAADAVAVLDATGTDEAVLVGFSCGVAWSVHVAAGHPDRVTGLVAIAPSCGLSVPSPERDAFAFDKRLDSARGWAKYNEHHWRSAGGYEDFVEFFAERMYHEPHSTKQKEDFIGWAGDIAAGTLADATAGRLGLHGAVATPLEPLCERLRCPVLVIHGSEDRVRPVGIARRLAELTGGALTVLDGVGHGVPGREPVRVNHLIHEFAERVAPQSPSPGTSSWTRSRSRRRRALYLSSPIGLGHARRDLAVAAELRERHPDLQIDWLAQDPVTRMLADAGETVHPASRYLASESRHVEDECADHDLNAFAAIRRMDETLVANFMIFDEVTGRTPYDLVVADEAWDVDHLLHENPELKRFALAWLTDFVGWLPMPDGGDAEAALTADHNAEMIEQRARYRRVRDRSVFVGNPDDVVDESFGDGLPRIRDWTAQNFDFAGYVSGFTRPDEEDSARLRAGLGLRAEEKLCLVTVGGSGVGTALLCRVLDAVPGARRLVGDLHFLVVCGPRIDPAALARHPGVEAGGVTVRGFLPDLYRHLAACDLAVVQGGLTTCMELTVNRRPFIYVPLRNHFEQNIHVRHRLERYGAGHCMSYEDACDPDLLAGAIAATLRDEVHYRPVETDGAARAADLIAGLL